MGVVSYKSAIRKKQDYLRSSEYFYSKHSNRGASNSYPNK